MKKGLWQRTGAILLSILLLTGCLTIGGVVADEADGTAPAPVTPADSVLVPGFQQIAESDTLRLCLNEEDHIFYVENKETHYRWSSAPLDMDETGINSFMQPVLKSMLKIDYFDHLAGQDTGALAAIGAGKAGSITAYDACTGTLLDSETGEETEKGKVTIERIENGFRVTYEEYTLKLTIPLEVTLDGDHVVANVITKDIQYDHDALTVLQVHVLPYMGAVGAHNEGAYAVIPDGSGALVRVDQNKANAQNYVMPVYGKDLTIAANEGTGLSLPCFGVSNGTDSLLAVIREDAADAYINCEGVGSLGSSHVHPWASFKTMVNFEYSLTGSDYYKTKKFEEGEIKAERLTVDYYPVSGDRSGYAQLAAKYREMLFAEAQLAAAKTEAALYMDVYATVRKVRSILGFKSSYDAVLTSTKDVETMVKALAEVGVDNSVVRYNAWNKQENTKYAVTNMKQNRAVGDVAQMVQDMKALNCAVYPSVNRVLTYQKSWNPLHTMLHITRDPASRTVMNTEIFHTTSMADNGYVLNYKRLDRNLGKLMTAADKVGAVALSDVGNLLYSDFSNDPVKRPAFVEMLAGHLSGYSAENALMLDAPNGYAGVYADEIINMPTASSGQVMLDESVPFLQLVYSGITRYATEAINMDGSPSKAFLKALEYGCMPTYAWIGGNVSDLINTELDYLYSADYRFWLDTAAEQYATIKEMVSKAEGSVMVAHEKLADNVYRTTYANGASVVVNYNNEAYTQGGLSVPAEGYVIQDRG